MTISVHADGSSPWLPWKAELHQDHQLAGSIWSAKESGFIEPQTLVQSLVDETYVLIGETHDNPDHHLIQAWLIEEISEQRLVGLVVEMINSEQVEAMDDYLVSPDASAEGLGAVLDWEASGWPDWSIYRPIAEAAIAARLAFHSGDPGRDRVRRIGKEGLVSLGPQRRQELGLERDLPADLNQALADELVIFGAITGRYFGRLVFGFPE